MEDVAPVMEKRPLPERMQQELSDRLLPLFDAVISERESYWSKVPSPDPSAVPALISSHAYKCASIAVACNLVPGPWGLLAIIPELTLITRDQLVMVYDIGKAYGHNTITRELLLGIALSGAGAGGGGLVVIHGSKVIVKRSSLRVIQKLIAALGGKVTQRVLKAALAKWVPIAGAAALGLWARHSTTRVGEKAVEVFRKRTIEFVDGDLGDVASFQAATYPELPTLVEVLRVLVQLTHVDRRVDSREAMYLAHAFQEPQLPPEVVVELKNALEHGPTRSPDYDVFVGQPEATVALVMDMIALAGVDGEVHPAERAYVIEVGRRLGLRESEVLAMLDAGADST